MSTRKVRLSGIGYWGKIFESNRDLTGYEDALKEIGGQTTIDVDLDADNFALLKKSKSMKKGSASPDNEGYTRVKFTRKWTDAHNEKNGGPPVVVKADGTPWDFDIDGFIGNGSTVEVILSVYDTSRKAIVGTRLDKVKVLEHKVYEPDEDDTPAPESKVAPKKTTVKPTTPRPNDFEEDSLPF